MKTSQTNPLYRLFSSNSFLLLAGLLLPVSLIGCDNDSSDEKEETKTEQTPSDTESESMSPSEPSGDSSDAPSQNTEEGDAPEPSDRPGEEEESAEPSEGSSEGSEEGEAESGEEEGTTEAETESDGEGSESESGEEPEPIGLEVDCSVHENSRMPICLRPASSKTEPGSFGEGVTVESQPGLPSYGGGVVWGDELFIGVKTGNDGAREGYLSAVDLSTGDRRVVSGTFHDPRNGPQTIGEGPGFGYVNDAAVGPEDQLYILASPTSQDELYIVEVDPDSGDRSVLWGGNDDKYGQCPIGGTVNRVRIPTPWNIAAGASNEFYIGFSNNPSGSGVGIGKVRIGNEETHCELVSLSGHGEDDVGNGVQFSGGQLRGLTFHDGYLFAINDQAQVLFRVDLSTGDRRVISSADVGEGTAMGVRSLRVIPGDRWWTGGGYASSLGGATQVEMNPDTGGDRHWFPFEHGPASFRTESELWVLDNGLLMTVVDGCGLVLVDPESGNSNLFSY